MKQKLLNSFKLRATLLVAILCSLFTGTAWGDTTDDLLSENFSSISNGNSTSSSGSSTAWSGNTNFPTVSTAYQAGGAVRLGSGSKTGSITSKSLSVKEGTLTVNFDVKGWGTSGEVTVTFNGTTETITYSTSSWSDGFVSKSIQFTVDSNVSGSVELSTTSSYKRAFLDNIIISNTYTTGGGSLTASDLAITGAPVALNFDLYNNSSAQTVNFTTSSTGAVTVSGGTGYVTTSVSGNTITVTPTAVTPSAQTITISQEADATYAAGEATFTVTVSNSTPYTVTYSDGGSVTEASAGAGVTLATRSDVGSYTFAGWSTTNVPTETTTAPTIIRTDETYHPTANLTLYPVYTRTAGGGNTDSDNVFSSGSYNSNDVTITWSIANVVSILQEQNGAQTAPNSGYVSAPRWYSGNKITITPSASINSISVTATTSSYATALANSTYTNASASVDSNTDTKVIITPTNGNNAITIVLGGQSRLSSLTVNYGSSTTYYLSSPVIAAESDLTKDDDISLDFKSAGLTANIADYFTSSSDGAYTYDVADETVASITEGVVTGLKVGTTTITVSQAATLSYEAGEITIGVTVTDTRTTPGITFSSDEIDLTSGNEQTITVTTDHTGTRSVTSSDDDIASVEMRSGNVYVLAGDKGGTATITLSIAENGDYKATSKTFTVNVDDGLSDPTINISSYEIGINAVKIFTLTSNSEGGITISTDNEHAVLEDNGDGIFSLTSDTEGTVVVNVSQAANESYRAYETTFNISVVDNRETPTFSFSDASKTVDWADRGDYVKPTLTNTSDATVAYTSSNTAVATVASNGNITFVAGGTTTITASVSGSANYKDAQASYTLTVNKPFEFTETFASITGTGSASTSNFDNSGWASSGYIYGNSGNGIRMAKGDGAGSITTPALTGMPTNAKMTFKAQGWDSDETTISISGTDCTVSPTSFTSLSYSSFDECTAYITVTGDNPKITFSAASGVRIKLDDISITDLPNATISISNVEVKEGATANASITTNNETGAFTFVSSDEDVATVAKIDDDYVVTGVAEGTATITATQAGNTYYKTTSTTFTVNVLSATAVMNPTIDVASGTTVEVGDVIAIEAEEGCTIKYTTDNTDPTVSGTATSVNTNTASVTIPTGVNSLTLKAVAKNGENFSEVVTATYTVVKKTLSASFASDAIEVAIGADAAEPALTNPSGGTVTWESDDTDVVTVNSEGQLTAIAVGTATITASIAATDTYLAGTATYEVTVFDPTNVGISFNNTFFEIDAITTWKAGDPTTATGTHRNISVTYAKGEGSYYYCSDSQIRCYSGNTLSFTAPSGYYLSSIEFTSSTWNTATPSTGSMNDKNTKLWEGSANTVSFSWSSTARIESATVTLAETVTISSARFTTYVAKHNISFPAEVTAYIVTPKDATSVTLTAKASVPEGTAVVLEGDEGIYALPTIKTTPEDVTGNKLHASTGSTVGDGSTIYSLGNKSNGVGFYLVKSGVTVPAGKAYLKVGAGGSLSVKEFLSFDFEDVPTGLNDVRSKMDDVRGEIFNLAGQKINRLQKGINIVNGKKILVK